jgi:hypothetical protein
VLFSTGKGVYIVLKLVILLPCWVLKEEYIILWLFVYRDVLIGSCNSTDVQVQALRSVLLK